MEILGVDVSRYQEFARKNADQMYQNGIRFSWIKATETINYQDPLFLRHYMDLKSVGILVGAYHFVRPNNILKQATNFLNAVRSTEFELPYALDCEVSGITESEVIKMLEVLRVETGVTSCIYTNESFGNQIFKSEYVSEYPIWVASWTKAAKPSLPGVWKKNGKYLAWQYAVESSSEYGMKGEIDKDRWGNLSDFPIPTPPVFSLPDSIYISVNISGATYEGDIPKKGV
jgi:lysozyme